MGSSSKKHKEKEKDRKKRRRSRERDYGHKKDKHKGTHGKSSAYKERDNKRKYPDHKRSASSDDEVTVYEKIRIKDGSEIESRAKETSKLQDISLEEGELAVEPQKGGGESISISETNKLRAKLGLKPLQVDSSIPGLGISEDVADGAAPAKEESEPRPEVFVKTENMLQKKQVELLREKFAVNREKRKIAAKLGQVKTLGESSSEEDGNVISWVKKSRKIEDEKTKAQKRAKLLEEMDEEFGIGALVEEEFSKQKKSYGMKDLKGLTISHHPDAFSEGKLVVLTLKDQDVLAVGEDVLENVNLIDEEKAMKNVENKAKKPDYVAYEEPEFDEFGILKKKNILAKYDEELDGPKVETFKIGVTNMDREKELEMIRMKLRQQQQGVVTLEMPALRLATEYLTEEEMVKFKKPKKKVRKVRKRLKADDLLNIGTNNGANDHGSRMQEKKNVKISGEMSEEINNANGSVTNQPDNMDIDNDDFEPAEIIGPDEDLTGVKVEEDGAEIELDLALQKARKLKLKESREANFNEIAKSAMQANARDPSGGVDGKGSNIILNATAEFCRTLGEIPTYGMSGNRDEEAEELMDYDKDVTEDRKMLDLDAQIRGAWNEVDIDDQPVEIQSRENQPILEEEPDVSVGMAGALKLAMKKGYLEKEYKKLFSAPRPSQLQAQTYTIEEKFYEDDKFGRRDRYTGPIQDFKERDAYKPDVKLEYIDDSGRLLNPKEAFRYLSHKFHGKGPGKNKVDKRTKKLDQEGKLKQMSSTDTPLGTLRLLQDKQKELQSPFILLSGGSKALTQSGITKPK